MTVVSDASPILNLSKVDYFWLLRSLYGELIIPQAVQREFLRNGFQTDSSWMRVVSAIDRDAFTALLSQLDPGEAEAIVIATELSAELVLIDEKLGRRVAITRGLKVTGLLGVLAEAKSRGFVASCRPVLDEMIKKAGFWIGEDLRREFLLRIGENWEGLI